MHIVATRKEKVKLIRTSEMILFMQDKSNPNETFYLVSNIINSYQHDYLKLLLQKF